MKKAKKKNRKLKKYVVIIVTAVLCFLLFSGFLIFYLINENKYFEIESRAKDVSENTKKDKDNRETIGWIRIQGTDIDYPVLYVPDHNFTYEMGDFAWTEAKFDELNNITYIKGHNILNLSKNPLIGVKYHSRFEQLMSFTYFDFVKENKYIQYTINGEDYLFKIFAVSYPRASEIDDLNTDKYSKKEMQKYIDKAKEESIFDFDVNVNSNDKIISLITCTRMFDTAAYSFKVDARLVRKLELVKNYDVKKTKKYKEVEKQMKGGNSNEESNEEI